MKSAASSAQLAGRGATDTNGPDHGTSEDLAVVPCGTCGELIVTTGGGPPSSLLLLECGRCGTMDVYHARCRRPFTDETRR
jgi:hypothetical protein